MHASSSAQSTVEQLAGFAGVLTTYEDAFGEEVATPDESVRSVLRELGFDASSDAAAASLAAAREAEWLRMLAPVYVVAAETAPSFAVRVAVDAALRPVQWRIEGEGGTRREGRFVPGELSLRETGAAEGREYARYDFSPSVTLVAGYYRLTVADGPASCEATVAAVPPRCYFPANQRRAPWGLAVQLYGLRSARNWGIGDFTDLATLVRIVAAAGGDAVGVNPLHQLTFDGGAPSPYSPSSRAFYNWIYLDVEALPGFAPGDVLPSEIQAVREPEYVDYEAVARLKRRVARAAYDRFCPSGAQGAAPAALAPFRAFVQAGGEALRSATAFEYLTEHFRSQGAGVAWQGWPQEYRRPQSSAVRELLARHERDVEFCAYLQWQSHRQLGAAAEAAKEMSIGLYRDVAVGAELGGADSWSLQGVLKSDVSVGAPPDLLNRRGQNWGVAPFDPRALRATAYAAFIALLRANMEHAGAVRIDHVMALLRLYWIPEGVSPSEGAYVTYPLDELIGLIALESERARCIVIGEDLGTVPGGLRERLTAANILSYRLLQFENDDERFLPPQTYPPLALMCTGTHDLPFVGAYWTAHDVEVRAALGLIEGERAVRDERIARAKKRAQLLDAWRTIGLTADDAARFQAAADNPADRTTLAEIAFWANRYLARARGFLLMVQIEDVLGEVEQANVPNTTTEHPNWRRRLALDLETFARDERFTRLARMLERERPRPFGTGAAEAGPER